MKNLLHNIKKNIKLEIIWQLLIKKQQEIHGIKKQGKQENCKRNFEQDKQIEQEIAQLKKEVDNTYEDDASLQEKITKTELSLTLLFSIGLGIALFIALPLFLTKLITTERLAFNLIDGFSHYF